MSRALTKVIFLGVSLAASFIAVSCRCPESKNQVCFKERCIDIEVAREEQELRRGLQFRDSLDENAGMLFVFPEAGSHSFWMKDTRISLDMIWMDENGKVIFIASVVPPCAKDPCPVYGPLARSNYVLEVNAGYAKKLKITVGDWAEFRLFK